MDECVAENIDMQGAAEAGHEYRCLLDYDTCDANARKKGVA